MDKRSNHLQQPRDGMALSAPCGSRRCSACSWKAIPTAGPLTFQKSGAALASDLRSGRLQVLVFEDRRQAARPGHGAKRAAGFSSHRGDWIDFSHDENFHSMRYSFSPISKAMFAQTQGLRSEPGSATAQQARLRSGIVSMKFLELDGEGMVWRALPHLGGPDHGGGERGTAARIQEKTAPGFALGDRRDRPVRLGDDPGHQVGHAAEASIERRESRVGATSGPGDLKAQWWPAWASPCVRRGYAGPHRNGP